MLVRMRKSEWAQIGALTAAGGLAAAFMWSQPGPQPRGGPPAAGMDPGSSGWPAESVSHAGGAADRYDEVIRERARIHAHLKRAEAELRRRDVSHLGPEQQRARARHLDMLGEYRAAGRFPAYRELPAGRAPAFVDERGQLGAVAYLMARSGDAQLVERIAAAHSHTSPAALIEDPDLAVWLERAGLSAEEASLLQGL